MPSPTDSPTHDTTHGDGASSAVEAVATEPAAQQTGADTAEAAGLSLKGAPDHVEDDFLPINGTDYVEFYVGNAKQAAHFYASAFGFEIVAYRGPETGHREAASYVLEQDKIRFVFTTSIGPDTRHRPARREAWRRRQGHRALGRRRRAASSKRRGSAAHASVREPEVLDDETARSSVAAIGTYGETIHTFVERKNYDGLFLPGFEAYDNPHWTPEPRRAEVRRPLVGNVHFGDMNMYVQYY